MKEMTVVQLRDRSREKKTKPPAEHSWQPGIDLKILFERVPGFVVLGPERAPFIRGVTSQAFPVRSSATMIGKGPCTWVIN